MLCSRSSPQNISESKAQVCSKRQIEKRGRKVAAVFGPRVEEDSTAQESTVQVPQSVYYDKGRGETT